MKFLVLCTYELSQPTDQARSRVASVMKADGFEPVGFDKTADGLTFGLPAAGVSQFRAPTASVLRARVRRAVEQGLASRDLNATVSVLVRPVPVADGGALKDTG
jgi:hypothetical protein